MKSLLLTTNIVQETLNNKILIASEGDIDKLKRLYYTPLTGSYSMVINRRDPIEFKISDSLDHIVNEYNEA